MAQLRAVFRKVMRPMLGLTLLAFLASRVNSTALIDLLLRIDVLWFCVGLLAMVASNALSAYRWMQICTACGISLNFQESARIYAEGLASNSVLPGGVLSGDAWRTICLVRRGSSKNLATLTVVLDRLGGFWILSMLSLIAMGIAWIFDLIALENLSPQVSAYAVLLAIICASPLLLFFRYRLHVSWVIRTVWVSVLIQLCAQFALWTGFRAIDYQASPLLIGVVATGIFLFAVVPISFGGFGPRELATVTFLVPLGVPAEVALMASIIYGTFGIFQAVIALVFWVGNPAAFIGNRK